jgi:hypothetical protein
MTFSWKSALAVFAGILAVVVGFGGTLFGLEAIAILAIAVLVLAIAMLIP